MNGKSQTGASAHRLRQLDAQLRKHLDLPPLPTSTPMETLLATQSSAIDQALEAMSGAEADDSTSAELAELVTAVLNAQLQVHQGAARRALFGPKVLAASLRRVAAQPSAHAVARQGCTELIDIGGFTTAAVVEVHDEHFTVIAHAPERGAPRALPDRILQRPGTVEADCIRNRSTVIATAESASPEFGELLGGAGYCVAPVLYDGHAVALVHATTGLVGDLGDLGDDDLHIVGLYADTMATSYAREVGRSRMASQHDVVARQAAAMLEATKRLIDADLDLMGADQATITRSDDTGQSARIALTPREQEIMHLIADGATNNEIAERLFISLETVKSHVKKILRKTGSVNRSEAIARYLENR
mgnify:CR=1 FL=1